MTELNPEWRLEAECYGMNPELFFIDKGESSAPARAVCATCDVQVECLTENLHERMGILGGTSERERRKIRRLGITAAQYIEGLESGTFQTPKRGRPAQIGA